MASLAILVPAALLFVIIAVSVFLWAVNNDQFEDLDRESRRILFDDEQPADTSEDDGSRHD